MGTLSEEQKTYTATTKQGKNNNNKPLVTKSSNVKSNLFARKGRRSLADLESNWRSSKPQQQPAFGNNSRGQQRAQDSSQANMPSASKYIPPYQRDRTGSNSSTSSAGGSNNGNNRNMFYNRIRNNNSNNNRSYNNNRNNNNNNRKYQRNGGNNNQTTNNNNNNNNNNKKHPDLYKTQLCDTFEEFGECKYGDNCQYAHGKHELRDKPEIVQPSAYKTVRCKNYWSKDSICPYGNKCKFVHEEAIGFDADKVNKTKAHKNYKTKECETFNKVGSCPYGDKCAFIHKPKNNMFDPSSSVEPGDLLTHFISGNVNTLKTCRRVSQEFENDVFGMNFASHVTDEQKEVLQQKKEEDVNGYIDALATMDSVTSKDGMNLYAGAPLKRQSSIEIFQEHSRFSKWMGKNANDSIEQRQD